MHKTPNTIQNQLGIELDQLSNDGGGAGGGAKGEQSSIVAFMHAFLPQPASQACLHS